MQLVPYRYLDEDVLDQIIHGRLERLRAQFATRYDATLTIAASARDELRSRCTRHENGARLLDACIDGELLPPLSLAVLQQLAAGKGLRDARLHWAQGAFAAHLD
ncbi:hypothetical protein D3C86_1968830 [compost metagenome]